MNSIFQSATQPKGPRTPCWTQSLFLEGKKELKEDGKAVIQPALSSPWPQSCSPQSVGLYTYSAGTFLGQDKETDAKWAVNQR